LNDITLKIEEFIKKINMLEIENADSSFTSTLLSNRAKFKMIIEKSLYNTH
jgi:hypothetical protein